ncbi:uncharacterized protein LOC129752849 [Uranotaenia lowii]|uniref:uncharacterized protein LOC129752849 n=1 Tax=Uranotaenia lowii TaxID=190385 RepID=UPI00247A5A56|nr:uncharacterized protein LOC129752849 [Uranotaenia lowii]
MPHRPTPLYLAPVQSNQTPFQNSTQHDWHNNTDTARQKNVIRELFEGGQLSDPETNQPVGKKVRLIDNGIQECVENPASPFEQQELFVVYEESIVASTSGTSSANPPAESASETEKLEIFSPIVLERILKKTEGGKKIIADSKVGPLSSHNQKELCNIICAYHRETKSGILSANLQLYDLVIRSLLPFEKPNIYYIPAAGNRRNPGGKIANKLVNLKTKHRRQVALEQDYQKQLGNGIVVPEIDGLTKASHEWLLLNRDPWQTVLQQWEICFELRKPLMKSCSNIVKLLSTYPHYKLEHGYQLVNYWDFKTSIHLKFLFYFWQIDIDFRILFGNRSNGKRLKEVIPNITGYLSKKARDPSAVDIIQFLQDTSAPEDPKLCALILGLATVLPPIAVTSNFKPTILKAQEDIVLWVECEDQIGTLIENIYATYAQYNIPIVPKLAVIGFLL